MKLHLIISAALALLSIAPGAVSASAVAVSVSLRCSFVRVLRLALACLAAVLYTLQLQQ